MEKMQFKHFYLIKDKVFGYTAERPQEFVPDTTHQDTLTNYAMRFSYRLQSWQQSAIEIPVWPGELHKIKMHIFDPLPIEPLWHPEDVALMEVGINITSFVEVREQKRCTNSCDWPRCTFNDCMEKYPAEWIKGRELFVFYRPSPKQAATCPTCGYEREVQGNETKSFVPPVDEGHKGQQEVPFVKVLIFENFSQITKEKGFCAQIFIKDNWVKEITGLHDPVHVLQELSINEDFRQLINETNTK